MSRQSGNVLFLILIAVALFGALSYVVTKSTRTGGSTDREKTALTSAQITQYPLSLRTAVLRMVLSGVNVQDIKFNKPGNFGAISPAHLVFHPQGGGGVYQSPPADVGAPGKTPQWYFNAHNAIEGLGTDGSGGNELAAFLTGVSAELCRTINKKMNVTVIQGTFSGIPDVEEDISTFIKQQMTGLPENAYTFPNSGSPITMFSNTPYKSLGCFYLLETQEFIFYDVLLER